MHTADFSYVYHDELHFVDSIVFALAHWKLFKRSLLIISMYNDSQTFAVFPSCASNKM